MVVRLNFRAEFILLKAGTELLPHILLRTYNEMLKQVEHLFYYQSGGRGSNPQRPAWEAGILPLNYHRLLSKIKKREFIIYSVIFVI